MALQLAMAITTCRCKVLGSSHTSVKQCAARHGVVMTAHILWSCCQSFSEKSLLLLQRWGISFSHHLPGQLPTSRSHQGGQLQLGLQVGHVHPTHIWWLFGEWWSVFVHLPLTWWLLGDWQCLSPVYADYLCEWWCLSCMVITWWVIMHVCVCALTTHVWWLLGEWQCMSLAYGDYLVSDNTYLHVCTHHSCRWLFGEWGCLS